MKTRNYISTLLATISLIILNIVMGIVAMLLLNSCQQEITEIIEPRPEEGFTAQTNISSLIQRTSMFNGSEDNIIDGLSCSALVLPVTIVVNGTEITINTSEDLRLVEEILDEFDDDDDDIVIRYPVKVILGDYSELDLYDEDDFEDLVDKCIDSELDDDIDCISFKYPVSISVYDAQNQVARVVTIENDRAMYKLIDDLDDDRYASFNFPIIVILPDGSERTITDHNALENLLDEADDLCREDVDETDFVKILTSGEWIITLLTDNDDDLTTQYNGYVFTFNPNGTVTAVRGNSTHQGTWEIDDDDDGIELELDFNATPIDELGDDWDIIGFDNFSIRLRDDDDRLTFSRP